ncbi:MAG: DUF2062 domain-containing protein [Spongiibacteraceae bacterium]|nr:DUF2062 domain-containing protein [Spongiibacteraceae bacterium]
MARKLIKRFIPDPEWIKNQRSLKIMGDWLHDPNIWHLTRHSVASATFIGLFLAFIPLPSQMIMAAALAVYFRANLAISVVLVWITNPLTVAPIFIVAYKVGTIFVGGPTEQIAFELSWEWLSKELSTIWQPLLLGSLLCGLFFGLLGQTLVKGLWRWYVIKRWHERRLRRQKNS